MKFDPVIQLVGKLFGSKNTWKTEGDRLKKLLDKGIHIPEELQSAMKLQRGRKKEELIDYSVSMDFVGKKQNGSWVNNKFANSRSENDLQPQDIWGYSAFFDKFGNDWLGKFSGSQREEIAQAALDLGAVDEHHGTIDINWTPELQSKVESITR